MLLPRCCREAQRSTHGEAGGAARRVDTTRMRTTPAPPPADPPPRAPPPLGRSGTARRRPSTRRSPLRGATARAPLRALQLQPPPHPRPPPRTLGRGSRARSRARRASWRRCRRSTSRLCRWRLAPARRCTTRREIWGDQPRSAEIARDRSREKMYNQARDLGRCGETWGGIGRCTTRREVQPRCDRDPAEWTRG